MEDVQTIGVDGQTFTARFYGWHVALDVITPAGKLAPWRLGDHAHALRARRHLDGDTFADTVLARCWTGEGPGSRALALWWALGGQAPEGRAGQSGEELEILLGEERVRLRPWSLAARIHALRVSGALDDPPQLDLGAWLIARVAGHVVDGAAPVETYPAAPLLAALRALEEPADGIDLATLPPRLQELIARACRALGWTPARVLETSSVEIDRLMSLLDRDTPALAKTPAPAPVQGLAAKPGAVVFQFEPDEEGA